MFFRCKGGHRSMGALLVYQNEMIPFHFRNSNRKSIFKEIANDESMYFQLSCILNWWYIWWCFWPLLHFQVNCNTKTWIFVIFVLFIKYKCWSLKPSLLPGSKKKKKNLRFLTEWETFRLNLFVRLLWKT